MPARWARTRRSAVPDVTARSYGGAEPKELPGSGASSLLPTNSVAQPTAVVARVEIRSARDASAQGGSTASSGIVPARMRLPFTAAPAIVLAVFALSACGSTSSGNGVAAKTPAEIVVASKAAADSAQSVHLSGSIVSEGKPITLDLALVAGKGGRGRISENGLSFDLIQFGGTVYISGSPAFYRHIGGTAAAQLFQGKWLKASASSADFASISSLTDLHKLVDTTLVSHGALAKGETTTVNGQKAVSVKDTSQAGTLYVASTGKPYPIEVSKSGSGGGKIVFDRWNESVPLAAPANAVDIAQLRAGH